MWHGGWLKTIESEHVSISTLYLPEENILLVEMHGLEINDFARTYVACGQSRKNRDPWIFLKIFLASTMFAKAPQKKFVMAFCLVFEISPLEVLDTKFHQSRYFSSYFWIVLGVFTYRYEKTAKTIQKYAEKYLHWLG